MRQTGKEDNVPVIDLNAMSKILYEAWGPEKSIKAFVHFPANTFPNQKEELKDNTHFTSYGAYELAKCIVNGIKQNVPSLAKYLKKNFDALILRIPILLKTFIFLPVLLLPRLNPMEIVLIFYNQDP